MEPGARVLLHGLQRRPDLNGRDGVIYKRDGARWGVVLGDEGFLLRPENLETLPSFQDLAERSESELTRALPTDVARKISSAAGTPLSMGFEVAPASAQESPRCTEVAVVGFTGKEERRFLKAACKFEDPRRLGVYSKSEGDIATHVDLVVYYDRASRAAANQLVTQAVVGPIGWCAKLPLNEIRGTVVIFRQGPAAPAQSEEWQNPFFVLATQGAAVGRTMRPPEQPLTERVLRETLDFYQKAESTEVARFSKLRASMGVHLDDPSEFERKQWSYEDRFGGATPCIVCGERGCKPAKHGVAPPTLPNSDSD